MEVPITVAMNATALTSELDEWSRWLSLVAEEGLSSRGEEGLLEGGLVSGNSWEWHSDEEEGDDEWIGSIRENPNGGNEQRREIERDGENADQRENQTCGQDQSKRKPEFDNATLYPNEGNDDGGESLLMRMMADTTIPSSPSMPTTTRRTRVMMINDGRESRGGLITMQEGLISPSVNLRRKKKSISNNNNSINSNKLPFTHWNRRDDTSNSSSSSSKRASPICFGTSSSSSMTLTKDSVMDVSVSSSHYTCPLTLPLSKMRRTTSEPPLDAEHIYEPNGGELRQLLLAGALGTEHCLPCFDSSRDAIKRISPEIMVQVLQGDYSNLYSRLLVVDCRYPYEYLGGHLPGAINVPTLAQIDELLFGDDGDERRMRRDGNTVIIFHCEFSSERAPRMALHVRNFDRTINASRYPSLYYPQLYILDSGYKGFFARFPERCEPPNHYVPMRMAQHRDELRHHQRLRFKDGTIPYGKHHRKLRSCSLSCSSVVAAPMRKAHSLATPYPVTAITSFFRTREGVGGENDKDGDGDADADGDGDSHIHQMSKMRTNAPFDGTGKVLRILNLPHDSTHSNRTITTASPIEHHSLRDVRVNTLSTREFLMQSPLSTGYTHPGELLSSDHVEVIYDESNSIIQAAELCLLAAFDDGRVSK